MGCFSSKHESPRPEPGAVELKPQVEALQSERSGSMAESAFAFDGFLSHDWGTDALSRSNHDRVITIARCLGECGLRCWLDEDKMQGDINEAMTDGIDGSATVLVFITERYLVKAGGKGPNGHNDNCKLEFDYASNRKGIEKMVAVVMEPQMRSTKDWSGVVGAKLGTSLYVDLSANVGDPAFTSGVQQLAKEMRKRAGTGASHDLQPQAGAAPAPAVEPSSVPAASKMSEASPAGERSTTLAALPLEVPMLPDAAVQRPELISALTTSVTDPSKRTSKQGAAASNTTAANGMGGVGKTMLAAAFVREESVRAAFGKVCWASIGQEPNTSALQAALYRQLADSTLSETARTDELLALSELKAAAKELSVLLVLDDVWNAAHVGPLNFVDPSAPSSAVLVTTRIHGLIGGASEVRLEVLSEQAALELLLRTGGREDLLAAPPPAALEAIELCGRLPLALGIAGSMIDELADVWEDQLVPFLRDELEEATIEERLVNASLKCVKPEERAGVEALFLTFGCFPEDAVVPAVVLDVLAPLIYARAGEASKRGTGLRKVRQWLKSLLKASLLRGSIGHGLSVHDLIRDVMLARMQANELGVVGFHRQALELLLAAYNDTGADTSCVAFLLGGGGFIYCVGQSKQPGTPVHEDVLLMQMLLHKSAEVCASAAAGIGLEVLKEAISTCEASDKWWEAAQLNYALSTTRGLRGGEDVLRAWAAVGKMAAETDESRALEARILSMVLLSTEGGLDFTSPEYSKAMVRANELRQEARASGGDDESAASFEAALGSGISVHMKGVLAHGFCNFVGFAPSVLEASHADWMESCTVFEGAASSAPDVIRQDAAAQFANHLQVMCNRIHTLAGYEKLRFLGEGGSKLRANVDRYDFGQMHAAHKSGTTGIDLFLYASNEAGLLLFFNDLAGARAGWEKQVDAWRRIEKSVQSGERTWDSYIYEGFMVGLATGAAAMMAAGETRLLREYLRHHACGSSMLSDPAASSGLTEALTQRFSSYQKAPFWWGAPSAAAADGDGHRYVKESSIALQVRALVAVLDMDAERDGDERIGTDSDDDAALRAWLPPASELLYNAQREWHFYALMRGAAHPALLCAALYGRRLGAWEVASEIAEGFLALQDSADDSGRMEPLARIEAWRLLARGHETRGDAAAACEALKAAQGEATAVGYVFMEELVKGEEARILSRLV